jgi:hypothetical protein
MAVLQACLEHRFAAEAALGEAVAVTGARDEVGLAAEVLPQHRKPVRS